MFLRTSTNVTVNGLPTQLYQEYQRTLYIEGAVLDISEQTKYNYTVTSLGGDSSQANGSITLNPSSTVTLTVVICYKILPRTSNKSSFTIQVLLLTQL